QRGDRRLARRPVRRLLRRYDLRGPRRDAAAVHGGDRPARALKGRRMAHFSRRVVLLRAFALAPSLPARARDKQPKEARKRGTATAEETRPDHFPHRIWAACDFEAQTPDYAWFGPKETKQIPKYPGNSTALGVQEKPYKNVSALMTGINPVPGPMM